MSASATWALAVGGVVLLVGVAALAAWKLSKQAPPPDPQLADEQAAAAKAEAEKVAAEEAALKKARADADAKLQESLGRWQEGEKSDEEAYLDGSKPLPRPPGGARQGG